MRHITFAVISLAVASSGFAQSPKVIKVKEFTGIYPASASLQIPFNGCVVLDAPLPPGKKKYWLSLDHLIQDADFTKINVLVNVEGTILGGSAVFKGSPEEWRGVRGLASRNRVLFCSWSEGDGVPLPKNLPLIYDGRDFSDMIYTFSKNGHVSWKLSGKFDLTNEAEYVARQEKHKRECESGECKDMDTSALVVLPREKPSEQRGAGQPAAAPQLKSGDNEKPISEPGARPR